MSVVKFEVIKPDWTREAIVLLIHAFKAQTVLYDYENKLYHHKHTRNEALRSIAKKLKTIRPETTIDHIKLKMGSIRSQYVGEIKKLKKSIAKNLENSAEEIYIPTVWWFSHMTFILKYLKKEPYIDNDEEILKIIEHRIKNNKFVDEKVIVYEANEKNSKPKEVYLECITPKRIESFIFKQEKNDDINDCSSDLTNDSLDFIENNDNTEYYDKSEDDNDQSKNITQLDNDRAPTSDNNSFKTISRKRKLNHNPKFINNNPDKTIKSFCNWMSDELIAISNNTTILNDTKRELFDIIFQAKEKYNKFKK